MCLYESCSTDAKLNAWVDLYSKHTLYAKRIGIEVRERFTEIVIV
jgi:hypothetical protein